MRGSISAGVVAAALLAVAAASLPPGSGKVDVLRHDLGDIAAIAGVVGVVPHLEAAIHQDHAALGEVPADELSGLPPGDDVDEIRILGVRVFALVVSVAGDAEGDHSCSALSVAQLWVRHQAAL